MSRKWTEPAIPASDDELLARVLQLVGGREELDRVRRELRALGLTQGKAGRRAGTKIRTPGQLQAMTGFVHEVHREIRDLKREFFRKSDNHQLSYDERAERVEERLKDFRAAYPVFKKGSIISELTKRLERGERPSDIVEWLARQQYPAYAKRKRAAR